MSLFNYGIDLTRYTEKQLWELHKAEIEEGKEWESFRQEGGINGCDCEMCEAISRSYRYDTEAGKELHRRKIW